MCRNHGRNERFLIVALTETATRTTQHRRVFRIGLVWNLAFGLTAVVFVFAGLVVVSRMIGTRFQNWKERRIRSGGVVPGAAHVGGAS